MNWESLLTRPSFELRRSGRFVVAALAVPHVVLSTSARNGGLVDHLRWIVNHQSCEGTAHMDRHKVITDAGSEGYHQTVCAEIGVPSAETAVAQPGGRLIVTRAANFGWNLALNLKIDGQTAANIVQGGRYDQFVPAGRHVLTVSAANYEPTSTVLNAQHGQTYIFTAKRENTDSVVLVPSARPQGQPH